MTRPRILLVLSALAAAPTSASAQDAALAPDVFLDPAAGTLYMAALENWNSMDESILRYSARIDQRLPPHHRCRVRDRPTATG